ncbi:chorion peroxidase-like [Amphibalanus amphitrite]|uniref:chorion peroxidase-like n=1 Tax=Amphibalanus amphitrite TaxID=1232801 RepID=UPI001C91C25E|nr:chorion peroxidase-like [Amphibalanus amphitrite]
MPVVHQNIPEPPNFWTSTFSEYLSLDLSRIAPFRLPDGREPACCVENHPACLPLRVADRCVSFVRALPAPELDCVMRPAAPLSAASSYLDLETLYGSSEEAGRRLRTLSGGRLRDDRGLLDEVPELIVDLDNQLQGSSEDVLLRRRRWANGADRENVAEIAPDAEVRLVTSHSLRRKGRQGNGNGNNGNGNDDDDGEKGDKGDKGDPGEKGMQGEKGDTGEKGMQGEKGMDGEKGMQGDKGDPGEKGMKGEPGMKGEMGEKGMQGDKGDMGEKGMQGDKGDMGDKGDTGEKGMKGEPGMKGDMGEKGEMGEKGDMGEKGMKGEQGMKGDMGEKGMQGEKGEQGMKGEPGEKGMQGEKGDPGMDGEKGMKGEVGEKGDQGEMGMKGETGEKGMKGETGIQGMKGEQGEMGSKGDKGDLGPAGAKGAMGKAGAMGPIGRPGPRGPPGRVRVAIPNRYGLHEPRRLWAPEPRSSTIPRPSSSSSPDQLNRVLLREHNRVVEALRRNHPLWEDERLFQTARRVVIAQWQHITYREYLPHVLGPDVARAISFTPNDEDDVDPTVSVEFAAAAFRFWQRPRPVTKRRVASGIDSSAAFLAMLHGTEGNPANHEDSAAKELAAVEVLRGRDLGLPSYTAIRQLCSGQPVVGWTDLETVFEHRHLEELRAIYSSPDDIDLWVGGMLERRAPSAKVGPTFQCVIADQFRRLRDGDRLFYERSLSGEQLREVRKASLARLLCDNEEGRTAAAPLVLEPLTERNKITPCSSKAIPEVDLSRF